jgi:RNA polymerase sigma factor for flagellar operon FliA
MSAPSSNPGEDIPAVQNQLVVDHIDLIGHIVAEVACRYPRHVDRTELWNAGALGLVEASRRFKSESGIPFSRYAAIRIRGAIIDSTRTRDWATRSLRRKVREVQQTAAFLTEQSNAAPTSVQLADALGISEEDLASRQAQATMSTLLHLDQAEPNQEPLAFLVAEERTESLPDLALEQRELRGTLASAIRHLPQVQAEVVTRYYLSGDLLQDIAEDLDLTEARVSQIRAEALAAMRTYFSALYEGIEPTPDNAPGKRARASYVEKMEGESWRSRLDLAQGLEDILSAV